MFTFLHGVCFCRWGFVLFYVMSVLVWNVYFFVGCSLFCFLWCLFLLCNVRLSSCALFFVVRCSFVVVWCLFCGGFVFVVWGVHCLWDVRCCCVRRSFCCGVFVVCGVFVCLWGVCFCCAMFVFVVGCSFFFVWDVNRLLDVRFFVR